MFCFCEYNTPLAPFEDKIRPLVDMEECQLGAAVGGDLQELVPGVPVVVDVAGAPSASLGQGVSELEEAPCDRSLPPLPPNVDVVTEIGGL